MTTERERTTQVSVSFVPWAHETTRPYRDQSGALRARPAWFRLMHPHMLIEDVHTGIMPYMRVRGRRACVIRLDPDDERASHLVSAALPSDYGRGGYRHRNLAEAICDFVRDCAGAIMNDGQAFYELVYLLGDGEGEPVGFRLSHIPTYTVVLEGGHFLQELPPDEARHAGKPRRVRLPEEDILSFKLPKYARASYWQMMNALALTSVLPMPEWAMKVSAGLAKGPHYDLRLHRSQELRAIALATRDIGWNARNLLADDMLEHYYLQRHIRFEEFKIRLRDEIINMLNLGLKRAGDRLAFVGSVVVEGLPTLDDIARWRTRLADGSCTFEEILDAFSRI